MVLLDSFWIFPLGSLLVLFGFFGSLGVFFVFGAVTLFLVVCGIFWLYFILQFVHDIETQVVIANITIFKMYLSNFLLLC